MSKNALSLLNSTEQSWLVDNIREAEKSTTGEIRVHLEDYSLDSPLDRATEVFAELDMHNTRYRNGVLIYIAVQQHNFSIIGDMGINHVVDDTNFWTDQVSILKSQFRKENYYEGLMKVINNVGQVLSNNFPAGTASNPNELPDEISFG